MEHKLILLGLFYALLQASFLRVAKGVNPAQALGDRPLSIYLDAGTEMESILSLAKKNEEKLTHVENVLASMSAKMEASENRMSAKMDAFEKRMAADKKQLNQNVLAISSQLSKSSLIYTPRKRPAELACEAIENELRSIGVTKSVDALTLAISPPKTRDFYCKSTLIDKRFLMTSAACLNNARVEELKIYYYLYWQSLSIDVKRTHVQHPGSPNGIALIELDSDVEYSTKWYPECLYTKQSNPENELVGPHGKFQIVSPPDCLNKTCVKITHHYCTWPGEPVFEVMENAPTHRLFGMATQEYCRGTFPIINVFDHLDYIESIVWPKSGN